MTRRLAVLTLAAGLLLSTNAASAANAPQCRDQKGHFIACTKPVAATTTRCRSPAGQFVKCPAASGMAAISKPSLKK